MNRPTDYIAVFDSGVGGLSVLRELARILPKERYLYFGDSKNAPYGTRPTEEIKALTLAAAENLARKGIKALVVACNTATSAAIDDLRQKYPDLIVVGIEPALKLAVDSFPGGTIGVMATPVTLREEKFRNLLRRFEADCQIISIPAPGLVERIEEGRTGGPEIEALLEPLLAPYAGKLDALVLGCTHYPFVSDTLGKLLGKNTVLLHGGHGTALQTRRRLEKAGLLGEGPGQILIENSLGCEKILALSKNLLAQEVANG